MGKSYRDNAMKDLSAVNHRLIDNWELGPPQLPERAHEKYKSREGCP